MMHSGRAVLRSTWVLAGGTEQWRERIPVSTAEVEQQVERNALARGCGTPLPRTEAGRGSPPASARANALRKEMQQPGAAVLPPRGRKEAFNAFSRPPAGLPFTTLAVYSSGIVGNRSLMPHKHTSGQKNNFVARAQRLLRRTVGGKLGMKCVAMAKIFTSSQWLKRAMT